MQSESIPVVEDRRWSWYDPNLKLVIGYI